MLSLSYSVIVYGLSSSSVIKWHRKFQGGPYTGHQIIVFLHWSTVPSATQAVGPSVCVQLGPFIIYTWNDNDSMCPQLHDLHPHGLPLNLYGQKKLQWHLEVWELKVIYCYQFLSTIIYYKNTVLRHLDTEPNVFYFLVCSCCLFFWWLINKHHQLLLALPRLFRDINFKKFLHSTPSAFCYNRVKLLPQSV